MSWARPALSAGVVTLLTVALPAAAGELEEAVKQLRRGDYGDAIAALEKLQLTGAAEARRLEALGRAYLDVGNYDAAATLVAQLAKTKGAETAAAIIGAKVAIALGRYAEAVTTLEREIKARPKNFEARVLLAETRLATGTPRADLKEADAIADFWQSGQVKGSKALTHLGRALHLTGYFKDANQIYGDAIEEDPKHLEAHLGWALLFLEKENDAEADRSLKDVLKLNPNHPEALALTAYIDVSSDNDYAKAREHVEKALKTNPRSGLALSVKAEVLIHSEQVTEAVKVLEQALSTNPNDSRALALLGASHLLLEDDDGFAEVTRRALKVNKRDAAYFHVVAEALVRVHRYEDAIKLERRALELNSEYWPSYVGIGMGYSRLGDDAKANEFLQKAFAGDSFNVRAFNLTEHFYDSPAKKMVWVPAGPFRLRLPKAEVPVLKRLLPGFLTDVYDHHKKAYGFVPKAPLHVEIYKDDKTFGIRYSGYPRSAGVRGICFGHVVLSKSPSRGEMNWAMVLWHELAHVWHIQMSASRVPRWFTEGLAEHETTLQRPEWRRIMDEELWQAFKLKKLKGIAEFNSMFTQVQTLDEVVLAYYYASKVVAFIDKSWGFGVFPKMLTAWSKRQTTAQVFKEVLGVDLTTFDQRMREHLEKDTLARFSNQYEPGKEAADAPPDPTRKAYVDALEAFKQGRFADAAKGLDVVLAAGKDGATLRLIRGQTAVAVKDWPAARVHLEKALVHNDQLVGAYMALRRVLTELGDKDALYEHQKRTSLLSADVLDLVLELAAEAKAREKHDDFRTFVTRAMQVGPFVPLTRLRQGELWLLDKKPKEALAEADLAIELGLKDRALATVLKARALGALGKKADALKLLEPLKGNPEAERALKELTGT